MAQIQATPRFKWTPYSTQVQLCIVHLLQNCLRYLSWKDSSAVVADLKLIDQAAPLTEAEVALEAFEAKGDETYPASCIRFIHPLRSPPIIHLPSNTSNGDSHVAAQKPISSSPTASGWHCSNPQAIAVPPVSTNLDRPVLAQCRHCDGLWPVGDHRQHPINRNPLGYLRRSPHLCPQS